MHIEHIAIWAKDPERLKDFYVTYFGAETGARYVNSKKQFTSYFLRFSDGARLELMSMPSVLESANDIESQFTGYIHMALATGSEQRVNELTARLKADGYRVIDGPRRTGDGYYESSVLDPEGNRIEITV